MMMVMVKRTIAAPHRRTTNETDSVETETETKTGIEIEFTTRERMRTRMKRSIRGKRKARTPTRIHSRTPRLAGSAHRGVLRASGRCWRC